MSALRLITVACFIVPVGAVMLAAGAVAIALTVAMFPFCYLRNKSSQFLEALLWEVFRPS